MIPSVVEIDVLMIIRVSVPPTVVVLLSANLADLPTFLYA